jgi:hypothetical protein
VDGESQTDGIRFGQETSFATWSGSRAGLAQADMAAEWFNGEEARFPPGYGHGGDGTVDPQLTVLEPGAAEVAWSGSPWNDLYPVGSLQVIPDEFFQEGSGFCYETEFTAPLGSPDLYPTDFDAYSPTGTSIPGALVSSVAFSQVSHVSDE